MAWHMERQDPRWHRRLHPSWCLASTLRLYMVCDHFLSDSFHLFRPEFCDKSKKFNKTQVLDLWPTLKQVWPTFTDVSYCDFLGSFSMGFTEHLLILL